MADKNCIVVEHATKPYRVRKYNGKGEVVEEHLHLTKFSAMTRAGEINEKFVNVIERDW